MIRLSSAKGIHNIRNNRVCSVVECETRNVDMYKNYIAEIKNFPLVGGLADTFANHAISFAVSLGFTAEKINAYRNACIDGTPTEITLNLPTYTITNTISNDNIVTYNYTDDADSTIAYIGISSMYTDGANAFATLNEDLPN